MALTDACCFDFKFLLLHEQNVRDSAVIPYGRPAWLIMQHGLTLVGCVYLGLACIDRMWVSHDSLWCWVCWHAWLLMLHGLTLVGCGFARYLCFESTECEWLCHLELWMLRMQACVTPHGTDGMEWTDTCLLCSWNVFSFAGQHQQYVSDPLVFRYVCCFMTETEAGLLCFVWWPGVCRQMVCDSTFHCGCSHSMDWRLLVVLCAVFAPWPGACWQSVRDSAVLHCGCWGYRPAWFIMAWTEAWRFCLFAFSCTGRASTGCEWLCCYSLGMLRMQATHWWWMAWTDAYLLCLHLGRHALTGCTSGACEWECRPALWHNSCSLELHCKLCISDTSSRVKCTLIQIFFLSSVCDACMVLSKTDGNVCRHV